MLDVDALPDNLQRPEARGPDFLSMNDGRCRESSVERLPVTAANPLNVLDPAIKQVRAFWKDREIELLATQSLLFGRAGFDIFGFADMCSQATEHRKRIIDLAGRHRCRASVFGSPKNLRRGSLDKRVQDRDVGIDLGAGAFEFEENDTGGLRQHADKVLDSHASLPHLQPPMRLAIFRDPPTSNLARRQ
jgi:hypothetical protein